jgi:predicted dehydrogenase
MAPHIIDLPIWALNLGVPTAVSCTGGRYIIKDDGDAPDTQEIVWQYPNFTMTWMMNCANSFAFDFGRGKPARRLGIYFHGVNGTLFTDYNRHEVVPEGDFLKDRTPPPQAIPPSPGHEREWLDSVKSRKEPSCSVNYHYKVDLAITLANISYQVGRSIRFDPKSEKIIGDKQAAKLARPVYRHPWKFPSEYL